MGTFAMAVAIALQGKRALKLPITMRAVLVDEKG